MTPKRSPGLFDGQPVLELLVPLNSVTAQRQALGTAAELARAWRIPIRLLHIRTVELGDATIGDLTAEFRGLYPGVMVEGMEFEANDIAAGIGAQAQPQSLTFVVSDRASQWLEAPSIGEAVVQAADTMVLLAGSHGGGPGWGSPIVVPLDGSPRAESAIAPALALATQAGVRLWLVTAVPEATAQTIAALRAEGQEVSESAYLRSVASRLVGDGFDAAWEVVHSDDPVAAVSQFATNQGASMIVAATHGESGVARRLFGSVCMGLVERAGTPILVVKTDVDERALTTASV